MRLAGRRACCRSRVRRIQACVAALAPAQSPARKLQRRRSSAKREQENAEVASSGSSAHLVGPARAVQELLAGSWRLARARGSRRGQVGRPWQVARTTENNDGEERRAAARAFHAGHVARAWAAQETSRSVRCGTRSERTWRFVRRSRSVCPLAHVPAGCAGAD